MYMASRRVLYGVPYMGSKSKIATEIVNFLPSGKRLVDLMGGGMSITHCATFSNKYEKFLYNDINPLLVEMIQKAIKGEYNYKNFKPEFITRKMFEELKDKDGYVKYIWSYGNNGKGYLFGPEVEHYKHLGHDLIVFGRYDKELLAIAPDIYKYVTANTIMQRRLQLQAYSKKNRKLPPNYQELQQLERLQNIEQLERLERLQQLERLERLQQLERLERLQQLERLELTCMSYQDYEWQEGDIVYIDPPYENTAEYTGGFNHKEFYEWVATRPYQVFFSSYNNISDKRFKMVYASQKHSLLSGGNGKIVYECIYTNK